jgi:hypothetical protein
MATAAVRHIYPQSSLATFTKIPQNPPLYLHVTSTSKSGLEKAVAKIEELMQQELPNLVDERRFRRREPEQFERDEFGRVYIFRFPHQQFWLIKLAAQMARRAYTDRYGACPRF